MGIELGDSAHYQHWEVPRSIPLQRHNKRLQGILLLLLKKVGSARLRESDIHPISLKTPAIQCQPIDRKKRKVKRGEDYSRDRVA